MLVVNFLLQSDVRSNCAVVHYSSDRPSASVKTTSNWKLRSSTALQLRMLQRSLEKTTPPPTMRISRPIYPVLGLRSDAYHCLCLCSNLATSFTDMIRVQGSNGFQRVQLTIFFTIFLRGASMMFSIAPPTLRSTLKHVWTCFSLGTHATIRLLQ